MTLELLAALACAIFVSVAWRAISPPKPNTRPFKDLSSLDATGHGFGRKEYWRRKD